MYNNLRILMGGSNGTAGFTREEELRMTRDR